METPFNDFLTSSFSTSPIGVVDVKITRRRPGRVWYEATYWPAKLLASDATTEILPDQDVQVVGREGIMLIVIPLGDEHVAPRQKD